MYHKPTRPNPKKDARARRERNPLYWHTGGRQRIVLPSCNKCLKAMRKLNNASALCMEHSIMEHSIEAGRTQSVPKKNDNELPTTKKAEDNTSK